MRKSTTYHYAEGDVKQIIKDELKLAKSEWIEEISDRVNNKFTEKITQFKDQIVTLLDKVLLELQGIREEKTVVAGKLSEHSDTLEDHETRIGKVEQVLLPQN